MRWRWPGIEFQMVDTIQENRFLPALVFAFGSVNDKFVLARVARLGLLNRLAILSGNRSLSVLKLRFNVRWQTMSLKGQIFNFWKSSKERQEASVLRRSRAARFCTRSTCLRVQTSSCPKLSNSIRWLAWLLNYTRATCALETDMVWLF